MGRDQNSRSGPDARDAFDAGSLPGMRERLATLYAGFRKAEAAINRERAPPSSGGRLGEYRDRVCPGCAADPPSGATLVSAHGLAVVACPHCGFVYARNVLESSSDAARYRLSEIDKITMELRDSAPYLELEVARARYYLHRIASVERQPGALIEIGCGSGTFLVEAAKLGWEALGVEPGLAAAEQARSRGARIAAGYFPQDLPDPERRVDLVAMLDVLEHIIEPRPFLRDVKARLNPGGLLFVQVPNWDSLLVQVEGARSTIVAPGHWSYFTRGTLATLLAGEGFHMVHAETVVSEIDRITSYPADEVAGTFLKLRPGLALPRPLTPLALYDLDLGYKLIAIFRSV